MNAYYDANQKPHTFGFLEHLNAAFSATRIDTETNIKTIAKFKKLIMREEMLGINEACGTQKPDQLVFHLPGFSFPVDTFDEFMTSRLALFEDDGYWVIVDISSFPFYNLAKEGYYMLYGRFDFVENATPVFFATVLAPTGDQDKSIMKQTLALLKHNGILKSVCDS